jgi:hypothetical protein
VLCFWYEDDEELVPIPLNGFSHIWDAFVQGVFLGKPSNLLETLRHLCPRRNKARNNANMKRIVASPYIYQKGEKMWKIKGTCEG